MIGEIKKIKLPDGRVLDLEKFYPRGTRVRAIGKLAGQRGARGTGVVADDTPVEFHHGDYRIEVLWDDPPSSEIQSWVFSERWTDVRLLELESATAASARAPKRRRRRR